MSAQDSEDTVLILVFWGLVIGAIGFFFYWKSYIYANPFKLDCSSTSGQYSAYIDIPDTLRSNKYGLFQGRAEITNPQNMDTDGYNAIGYTSKAKVYENYPYQINGINQVIFITKDQNAAILYGLSKNGLTGIPLICVKYKQVNIYKAFFTYIISFKNKHLKAE